MQKLLFSFVVFSVLFVTGCQENSITDPVSSELTNKIQKPAGTVTRGSIPLEGILVFPGMGQSYYSIEGRISYTHELARVDPLPPSQYYSVKLNLSVDAILINPDLPGHYSRTISSESEDMFYVSENGFYILEKSFPVLGGAEDVEMILVCRFLVATDGVRLITMWLATQDTDGTATNKTDN